MAVAILVLGFSKGRLRWPFVYSMLSGALAVGRTSWALIFGAVPDWWSVIVLCNMALSSVVLVGAMIVHAGSRSQEPMLY